MACRTILRYECTLTQWMYTGQRAGLSTKGLTGLCVLESLVNESWSHCPAQWIQHAHSDVENLPLWMTCAYTHWQPVSTLPPLPLLHDTVDNETPLTPVGLTKSHILHLHEVDRRSVRVVYSASLILNSLISFTRNELGNEASLQQRTHQQAQQIAKDKKKNKVACITCFKGGGFTWHVLAPGMYPVITAATLHHLQMRQLAVG